MDMKCDCTNESCQIHGGCKDLATQEDGLCDACRAIKRLDEAVAEMAGITPQEAHRWINIVISRVEAGKASPRDLRVFELTKITHRALEMGLIGEGHGET